METDSEAHSHGEKVVGWRKYKTVFEVNGMFVEGITNIQITQNGDVYYGMSKLKDITNSPTVQSNLSEEDRTAGNASDKSIAQRDNDVKFSARRPEPSARRPEQTKAEAFKRWFGDSKIVNEDGSPRVMSLPARGEWIEIESPESAWGR